MVSAMNAVRNKEMSIYKAAAHFKVPRKTLDDRIKGHVQHGSRPGPSTVLSAKEEDALVSYLLYMAERGYPLTRTMVKAYAWAISKRSGKGDRSNLETGPGEKWWINFKQRHPQITLRRTDQLESSRAEALNPLIVREYFALLGKTLEENGLMNKPRQLYNCDETFLPLDGTREKAVTHKGTKNTYCQASGTSEHITLLCCASATGIPHPPMIIYAKSFPGGHYRFEGPDDALYACSELGWIDSELFLVWLKKVFLKHMVPQHPVLLLTDGHKSHITIDAIDFCRNNDIILFCLPPHTTHALQPLDVAVFKSLKDKFFKAVRALSFTKKNFVVSKREFSRVVKCPLEEAFSIPNIKSGFRKTGIFPFNPDAIPKHKMIPSSVYGLMSSESDSCLETSNSYPSSLSTPHSQSPSLSSQPADVGSPPASSSLVSPPLCDIPVSCDTPSAFQTPTPSTSAASGDSPGLCTQISTPSLGSSLGSPILNPLVVAGLVPEDLSDILATPPSGAAVAKKRTKRITGARNLTADEYVEMLRKDAEKKKEATELKEKRRAEKELKKKEREERAEERRKRKAEKRQEEKSKRRCLNRPRVLLESSSDSDMPHEEETAPRTKVSNRPQRNLQRPARFRDESDEGDGTLCEICHRNEPEGLASDTVFWVDCNVCGTWVHNFCAFKKNAVTRQFTCVKCSNNS